MSALETRPGQAPASSRRRWRQLLVVFRLEMGRTFFSRRGFWVYLLALVPLLLVGLYVLQIRYQAGRQAAWEEAQAAQAAQAGSARQLQAADFAGIQPGMTAAAVRQRLGRPLLQVPFRIRRRRAGKIVYQDAVLLTYSAEGTEYDIELQDGVVSAVHSRAGPSVGDEEAVFAGLFQFFTLRLVVFFGCLGIFTNLFRGELLDRSLHFYFLAPVRREVVLAGKFLAGLLAAATIFAGSVALQLGLLGWQMGPAARAQFLGVHHGMAQIGAYLGATVLGCVGYGAFFMAAGIVTRNPIVPAGALLIWESLNPFLPELLKRFSVIYYLVALAPVRVPSAPGTPPLLTLLTSGPGTLAPGWAIGGVLAVAAALLWAAAVRLRRLEINYAGE